MVARSQKPTETGTETIETETASGIMAYPTKGDWINNEAKNMKTYHKISRMRIFMLVPFLAAVAFVGVIMFWLNSKVEEKQIRVNRVHRET